MPSIRQRLLGCRVGAVRFPVATVRSDLLIGLWFPGYFKAVITHLDKKIIALVLNPTGNLH